MPTDGLLDDREDDLFDNLYDNYTTTYTTTHFPATLDNIAEQVKKDKNLSLFLSH